MVRNLLSVWYFQCWPNQVRAYHLSTPISLHAYLFPCATSVTNYVPFGYFFFPAAWWQQHGINCLELQRIATRILSQTCSSYGCEHNWSTFDQIHSKRRNRLAQKRLNDLIYLHYNLRLRERQLRVKPDDSISLDSVLSESLLDDWVVETEKPTFQEDEVLTIQTCILIFACILLSFPLMCYLTKSSKLLHTGDLL